MFRSLRLVAFAALLSSATSANALLIDFESGLDPFFTTTDVAVGVSSSGGYGNVADFTGGSRVAFNPYAAPTSTFDLAGPGTFDLTSFVIAGAWGSQTLGIEGLLNGAVSFALDLGVTTAAQLVNLNWSGIDALRINIDPNGYTRDAGIGGGGQHWALDNVRVNENVAVPEPAVWGLMLLGLVGLGLTRKSVAKAA